MEKNDQIEIKDEDIKEDDFTPEELEDDSIDWKAKAQELKGIAKRRATQLAKAKEKLKSVPDPKPENKPQDKIEIKKPNEPDYAKLAFLEVKGVQHPDDIKVVMEEADRLNLSLNDILQLDYIKSKLQTNKDLRTAKDGLPAGSKRSGGYTQHDVEYYLANPDKRPDDHELAVKVLQAKQAKEKQANTFSDEMYVG